VHRENRAGNPSTRLRRRTSRGRVRLLGCRGDGPGGGHLRRCGLPGGREGLAGHEACCAFHDALP
jgi:hypothetical protein